MIVEVDESKRIVYYWLSREELANEELIEHLRKEEREWNHKGFKICEFHSGTGDLLELTKELLIHNKKVMAEKIVKERMRTAKENSNQ